MSKSNDIFVMYEKKHCWLKIYHSPKWEVERIMWIGWKKNNENKQCFVDNLSKDVIRHIFKFLSQTNIDVYNGARDSKLINNNNDSKP